MATRQTLARPPTALSQQAAVTCSTNENQHQTAALDCSSPGLPGCQPGWCLPTNSDGWDEAHLQLQPGWNAFETGHSTTTFDRQLVNSIEEGGHRTGHSNCMMKNIKPLNASKACLTSAGAELRINASSRAFTDTPSSSFVTKQAHHHLDMLSRSWCCNTLLIQKSQPQAYYCIA